MAAESEIQQFFKEVGAAAAAPLNAATKDGTLAAIAREAIKDVRGTIHEVFFHKGEHGCEPGAPLNPTQGEIAESRGQEAGDGPPAPSEIIDEAQKQPEQRQGAGYWQQKILDERAGVKNGSTGDENPQAESRNLPGEQRQNESGQGRGGRGH